MLSPDYFLEQCTQQGAVLDAGLGRAASLLEVGQAIADTLVAGRPVTGNLIQDSSFCTDPISTAYVQLMNSAHTPDFGGNLVASCKPFVTGCTKAEINFSRWLEKLAAGDEAGGRIIVDDVTEAPIILQKGTKGEQGFTQELGETSGLALENITVVYGGNQSFQPVTLPVGSLVALRMRTDEGTGDLSKMRFSQLQGVTFVRMTGLLLSEVDWAEYYRGEDCELRPSLMTLKSAKAVAATALSTL